MDSLGGILGRKQFKQPDEMAVVKNYIRERYDSPCTVRLERDMVIVSVPNSALAGTIRLEQGLLIKECRLKSKRLVIRIG